MRTLAHPCVALSLPRNATSASQPHTRAGGRGRSEPTPTPAAVGRGGSRIFPERYYPKRGLTLWREALKLDCVPLKSGRLSCHGFAPRLSPTASCRSHPGRIFLNLRVRGPILAALLGLLAPLCAGQGNSPITLDTTNETLFAVLTAVNACGFDDGLSISDPVRLEIRSEVEKNLKSSDDAQATANAMCDFYQSTRGNGAAHDLSQYVSLALYLHGPPNFLPKVKEDEMPPDAGPIAGFGALLEKFYEKAGLHAI